jgi:hypothetical protein
LKRLIHFFSLAVMTQLTLMLSQLILLPIQVRLWGQSATAFWYSALALAAITFVVDCGLRTAGHAELMKAHAEPATSLAEANQFRQIWSWIRILIFAVTAALIGCDFLYALFMRSAHSSAGYPIWRACLIIACALETILVVRITYLDSLGKYRDAEASYFSMAVLRLTLSIPALLILHWSAAGLTAIYLASAAVALFVQGQWLCNSTPLLQLTDKFPKLSWRVLALARFTVAEPLANWTRLSLPVLIIGQIASPMAVTTYVALRAVFGAARSTIQQLARVASVEVLRSRSAGEAKRAESLLTLFVVVAVFFGSSVGSIVVVDNMRILGLWLKRFDRRLFQEIALAFSLTAPLFSYQIPMNLMFRMGQLARVASRHYGFVACSLIFAFASLLVRSLPVYLALLVTAETLLSVGFFESARASLRVAAAGSLTVCVLWFAARQNVGGAFSDLSVRPLTGSALLLTLSIAASAALLYRAFGVHLTLLRRPQNSEPPLAVAK